MGRIIYAEDDDIVGEIATNALFGAGHAVGWLRDGEAALQAMRFRIPDVAVLDLHMPKMDGMSVVRAMRVDPHLAMVPVLMLTAVSGRSDKDIAFYEGVDDYLTKPFDPEELVFRVEQLMGGNIRRTGMFA